jgi:hypothetical protein
MKDEELGPKPDPVVEEKEPNPGGADAIPDDASDEVLARDLNPRTNPADDVVPDEIPEPDTEKKQAPDGDEDQIEPPA